MKMYQLVSVAYLNQMEEALEKARKLLPDDQLQVTEPIVIRRHAAQDQAPVIYDSVSDITGPSTSTASTSNAVATTDMFDKVLDILPKNYRSKGREIVHFLRLARAGLNDVNKLIYPNNGSIGSSLYSLLKFSLLPEKFKGKLQRPIDYTDFVNLLKSVGAGENLYDASSVGLTSIPQQSSASTSRRNLPPMLP